MSRKRTSTEYNEVIGKDTNGDVIVFQETFAYSDSSKGCTGSRFEINYSEDVEEALNNFEETQDELWRIAVSDEATTQSRSEWCESNYPTRDAKIDELYDLSYSWIHEDIREAYDIPEDAVITCVGGGRMFGVGNTIEWLPGMREKYEPIIAEFEGE